MTRKVHSDKSQTSLCVSRSQISSTSILDKRSLSCSVAKLLQPTVIRDKKGVRRRSLEALGAIPLKNVNHGPPSVGSTRLCSQHKTYCHVLDCSKASVREEQEV